MIYPVDTVIHFSNNRGLLHGAFRSKITPALQASFRMLIRIGWQEWIQNFAGKGHCKYKRQKCLGSIILPLFRFPSKILQKILHSLHLAFPKDGCRSSSILYVEITSVNLARCSLLSYWQLVIWSVLGSFMWQRFVSTYYNFILNHRTNTTTFQYGSSTSV